MQAEQANLLKQADKRIKHNLVKRIDTLSVLDLSHLKRIRKGQADELEVLFGSQLAWSLLSHDQQQQLM